ncbi:MAG: hypothetical protein US94_C0002G0029 [Berkelbacteria bacterium GW2011_GWB1_38_5]|uniref:Uncharacterized protein n=2 Tax=Candidatus Berkelbacteria TaxID=1618330 RepID=A0A0G0PNX5_9BACT|nr:MAG: hypothetical protein US94_C0002G0029 [Berkelbacteria bacterium GW2011_GWB1_38_5]KKQ91031.1 MAG: hypothetical protein UT15_C0001G0011 [Berkelbacteria bacterium GW2011_GWA1_39_10]
MRMIAVVVVVILIGMVTAWGELTKIPTPSRGVIAQPLIFEPLDYSTPGYGSVGTGVATGLSRFTWPRFEIVEDLTNPSQVLAERSVINNPSFLDRGFLNQTPSVTRGPFTNISSLFTEIKVTPMGAAK